jgi:hypothetical protein
MNYPEFHYLGQMTTLVVEKSLDKANWQLHDQPELGEEVCKG